MITTPPPIPHSLPTLDARDAAALAQVINSGYLARGRVCAAFEQQLANYFDTLGCVAVDSGSSALHLALLALGLGPGREVICPTWICTAVLNAIHYTGATPVLVDIDARDFNPTTAEIEAALSPRTGAVIVSHLFGAPYDLRPLTRFGVPVVEDCTHAIGGEFHGRRLGSFGTISITSFYATKMIAAGRGGAVVTRSPGLLAELRDLVDFDCRDSYRVRYNYGMVDLAAALGAAQLERLDEFVQVRRSLAATYSAELADIGAVQLPCSTGHCYYRYVLRFADDFGAHRISRIQVQMREAGVETSRNPVYKPLHQYLNLSGFPVADHLHRTVLSLPIYPGLNESAQARVVESLRQALRNVHSA